ncbi:nicotinate-nucleotide--dimethylbenzimidazole phosphoribosyltransferase [uncultured Veillonella sp.]|uniref:nicotinate-nucleotide--dimethylbenzimidazole phosphoribosyltransferase n=2 Tax=uncultured Veillonella sp. TaxID=159268 RepID=UPI0025E7D4D5|nr:nicotinate-nucleotide--dimethylbenzimidazole phosphoribosyltransferase [uncultured Veillonella sp.]
MSLFTETCQSIQGTDKTIASKVQAVWERGTLYGSYGKLVEMVKQYAMATNSSKLMEPKPAMVISSADHGVAKIGVSAYPQDVTVGMTKNYLVAKGAGANALGNYCGADLDAIDVGIAGDVSNIPGLRHCKVAYGTKNFLEEPAMTEAEALEAIEVGIAYVKEKVGQGYNVFLVGEMGIGNTTASAIITAKYVGLTADEATGRGTNISDERLKVKTRVVQDALHKYSHIPPSDGLGVLQAVGGLEFACIVGIILGAAAHKALVILDGFNTTACALIAHAIAPVSMEYVMASHLSAEKGHRKALEKLGLEAYVTLGLCLGEASGGSVQMGMLKLAVHMHNGLEASLEKNLEGSLETHVERPLDSNMPLEDSAANIPPLALANNSTSQENGFTPVEDLKTEAMKLCRERVDNLTKPLYSLAKLEEIAVQLAGIFNNERPNHLAMGSIIFAGDTAVDGPQNHTKGLESKAVVQQLGAGLRPTNALAQSLDAKLYVVDVGLEANTSELPGIIHKKVSSGGRFFGFHEAFTDAEVDELLTVGKDMANQVVADNVEAIALGTVGERNLLSALALTKAFTKYDMTELLTDNECTLSIREKAERLTQTMSRYKVDEASPKEVLKALGSPEIVALVGFILEAAAQRRALVFDTAVTGAAVLAAAQIEPKILQYVFPSVAYNEPVHKAQMKFLGLQTYLNYNLAIDEAVGSCLGLSVIKASLHMLNDMKTFGEAEVTVAEDGPGNILQDGR